MGESNTRSRRSTATSYCDNVVIPKHPFSANFLSDEKQYALPAMMSDLRKEQVVPEDTTIAARMEIIPGTWQMPCHKVGLPSHHQIRNYPKSHGKQDQMQGREDGQPVAIRPEATTAIGEALSRTKEQQQSPLLSAQHQAAHQKQQRRNSSNKRVRRSSDHHKRASSSSNSRHHYHHHHHHHHPSGSGSNGSSASPTSSSTDSTKTILLNKHQHQDRVVRTDEIALFMRCKKRYSDPDFKPIPPAEGGWDLVKPDRVVSWDKTAENYIDFSSYLNISQNNTHYVYDSTWKSHASWIREIEQGPAATTTTNDEKQQQQQQQQQQRCGGGSCGPDASKKQSLTTPAAIVRPPPVSEIIPTTTTTTTTTTGTETTVGTAVATIPSTPPSFDNPPQQPSFATHISSVEEHNARPAIGNPRAMPDKVSKFANPLFDRNQQALWETRNAFRNTSRLSHGLDIKVAPLRRLSQPSEYTLESANLGPWSPSPATPPFTPHDWASVRAGHTQQEWTPPISPWSPQRHESYDSSFHSSSCSSCSSDFRPWDQAIWEDRFASIMKVVDDDLTLELKDNRFATLNSPAQQQQPPKNRRASHNDIHQSRLRWDSGTMTSYPSSSTSDGMAFVVANLQLLQNMVQTGSMGCRHCGSGTHAVARDCPYLPNLNASEAWLALHNASLRCDIHVFMEALDVYSKAHPTETLQSIAKRLQDSKSTLQLVALDTQVPSTTLLVDLQGIPRRRYTATPVALPIFDNKDNTIAASAIVSTTTCTTTTASLYRMPGMPPSVDQNLTRLAEAGIPRDLTEMAHCRVCKQSGHWAKDCIVSASAGSSSLDSHNLPQEHHPQQHQNAERHQHRYTDTQTYDYSPRRFSVNANTKRPDPTEAATAAAAANCHRLYYNLNEYVLVDGR